MRRSNELSEGRRNKEEKPVHEQKQFLDGFFGYFNTNCTAMPDILVPAPLTLSGNYHIRAINENVPPLVNSGPLLIDIWHSSSNISYMA